MKLAGLVISEHYLPYQLLIGPVSGPICLHSDGSSRSQAKIHGSETLEKGACFNVFQLVLTCFNLLQHASTCFNVFQLFDLFSLQILSVT